MNLRQEGVDSFSRRQDTHEKLFTFFSLPHYGAEIHRADVEKSDNNARDAVLALHVQLLNAGDAVEDLHRRLAGYDISKRLSQFLRRHAKCDAVQLYAQQEFELVESVRTDGRDLLSFASTLKELPRSDVVSIAEAMDEYRRVLFRCSNNILRHHALVIDLGPRLAFHAGEVCLDQLDHVTEATKMKLLDNISMFHKFLRYAAAWHCGTHLEEKFKQLARQFLMYCNNLPKWRSFVSDVIMTELEQSFFPLILPASFANASIKDSLIERQQQLMPGLSATQGLKSVLANYTHDRSPRMAVRRANIENSVQDALEKTNERVQQTTPTAERENEHSVELERDWTNSLPSEHVQPTKRSSAEEFRNGGKDISASSFGSSDEEMDSKLRRRNITADRIELVRRNSEPAEPKHSKNKILPKKAKTKGSKIGKKKDGVEVGSRWMGSLRSKIERKGSAAALHRRRPTKQGNEGEFHSLSDTDAAGDADLEQTQHQRQRQPHHHHHHQRPQPNSQQQQQQQQQQRQPQPHSQQQQQQQQQSHPHLKDNEEESMEREEAMAQRPLHYPPGNKLQSSMGSSSLPNIERKNRSKREIGSLLSKWHGSSDSRSNYAAITGTADDDGDCGKRRLLRINSTEAIPTSREANMVDSPKRHNISISSDNVPLDAHTVEEIAVVPPLLGLHSNDFEADEQHISPRKRKKAKSPKGTRKLPSPRKATSPRSPRARLSPRSAFKRATSPRREDEGHENKSHSLFEGKLRKISSAKRWRDDIRAQSPPREEGSNASVADSVTVSHPQDVRSPENEEAHSGALKEIQGALLSAAKRSRAMERNVADALMQIGDPAAEVAVELLQGGEKLLCLHRSLIMLCESVVMRLVEEAGRETLQLRHSVSLSTTDIETIKKTIGLRLHSASLVMQLLPQLLAISIEERLVVMQFRELQRLETMSDAIKRWDMDRISRCRQTLRKQSEAMQRNIKELIKSKASTSESYEEGIEQVVKAFVSKLDTLPGVRNQAKWVEHTDDLRFCLNTIFEKTKVATLLSLKQAINATHVVVLLSSLGLVSDLSEGVSILLRFGSILYEQLKDERAKRSKGGRGHNTDGVFAEAMEWCSNRLTEWSKAKAGQARDAAPDQVQRLSMHDNPPEMIVAFDKAERVLLSPDHISTELIHDTRGRDPVIKELVKKERDYVLLLSHFYEVYIKRSRSDEILPPPKIDEMFRPHIVYSLLMSHTTVLENLSEKLAKWDVTQTVGDVLLAVGHLKGFYIDWVNSSEAGRESYRKEQDKNARFRKWCQTMEDLPLEGAIGAETLDSRISSLLILPVQRVLKYPLLIKALLKETPSDHPDYPLLTTSHMLIARLCESINAHST